MNKTMQMILLGAAFILILLGLVAGFNFYIDPMCYYHCSEVDTLKRTENVYYQTVQTAVANPDAEILVLGSSRGEVVPPLWIAQETGLKTVNLSKAGAEVLLKIAVLNTALDVGAPVKKVVWIADYFELVRLATDAKTRITPVLHKYIGDISGETALNYYLERLQRLINHSTTEASFELLKNRTGPVFPQYGMGGTLDYKECMKLNYRGTVSVDRLKQNISSSYSEFGPKMKARFDTQYFSNFEKQIHELDRRGIQVVILVPPFHPEFMRRLQVDSPESISWRQEWLVRIQALSSANIKVVNYFSDGIPNDNGSPSYWSDGIHMTCKGMMVMLKEALNFNSKTKDSPSNFSNE